jgi:hypothetical protein
MVQVNHWVMRTILECGTLGERVDCVTCLLECLRHLLKLNNFNGVMELLSALQSSPIDRLKHTWSEIPAKKKKILEECSELMSREKNFNNFRQALRSINPPCIPFFGESCPACSGALILHCILAHQGPLVRLLPPGMYLSTLTFTELGTADFLPEDPEATAKDAKLSTTLINFGKR